MPAAAPRITLRLVLDAATSLGPGKADLLQGIRETGSIAAAGRRMGMSYKRAWLLVDTLNHCFREPLVAPSKGGKAGGGAALTGTGEAVLALYREAQAQAQAASAPAVARLGEMLAARASDISD